MTELNLMIEKIKKEARESWNGEEGIKREQKIEKFLNQILDEYSDKLGFSREELLIAFEKKRNYLAINYYQESNFPGLDKVKVFETRQEAMDIIGDAGFRCPNCKGISKDPYECDTGIEIKDFNGKVVKCDWKSYGLFGTVGKGLRLIAKDLFLKHGKVEEIFMPINMEE